MNKCLNCGKEIPEGRKFCSRNCSASYNNVKRERKPWTEEQRQQVRVCRVEQVCKYCGQLTGKKVRKQLQYSVCSQCKPFFKINLYEKLNLQEGPLEERYRKATELLESLYYEDRLSLTEIERKTGINISTIRWILTTAGESLRSRSDSQKVRVLEGKVIFPVNLKFKHGWYENWEGRKIFYRSSWELEYALQLDKQQVSYDVEDLKVKYFDSQKGEERVAIPDFHLLKTNEIVEIKSSWTYNEQNMKDKFKAYREAGFSPKLILDRKEIKI